MTPLWKRPLAELNRIILAAVSEDEFAVAVEHAQHEYERASLAAFTAWAKAVPEETKRHWLARKIARSDEQLLELQRARDRQLLRG